MTNWPSALRKSLERRLSGLATSALWPHFEAVHLAIGQMQSRLNSQLNFVNIQDAEFQVFSQFGGDGIIQYIVDRAAVSHRTFVELGAGDYRESNTRFLVQNNAWEGLVVDAGTAHVEFLETPWLRWRHRVYGRSAFITAENVNSIIADSGFRGDIGLLSIDLDGNDFWVLKSLDVVSPQVLVIEYNSVFGRTHAVTVPYDPGFAFGRAHPSQLYFGASLAAIAQLAATKGYQLVGSDRAGVNAFFVREDVAAGLPRLTVGEAWAPSQHRMPTDPDGWLPFESLQRARLELIKDLPLYDVASDTTRLVREQFGL